MTGQVSDGQVSGGQVFNASEYLLDRRLAAGEGGRLALSGVAGEVSYEALHDRVCRSAGALRSLGLQPEQRVIIFMADCPGFVVLYLAAMRMGAIPVPVSTMLHADGLGELLRDSRARLLATSPEFAGVAQAAAAQAGELTGVIVGGSCDIEVKPPVYTLDELATFPFDASVYSTGEDSPAFWLYTSGTTGEPKGAMHRHGSVRAVCDTYAKQVLGIGPDDRCLSAAKAFFAYGLGNSVLFPLSVGAVSILDPSPARPEVIAQRVREYSPSLFFAGPTFFANMLKAGLPADAMRGVRLAVSAGEALPAQLYRRWTSHFGVDILDGIGMTEMLHIFLSNRPESVRAGTTGVAVPGYELRIVDDHGAEVAPGSPGTLLVRGPSTATGYWSRYEASRRVFEGEWLRTGDTYVQDAEGYYTCLGRSNDMLKASGIWVSPGEVEQRLLSHQAVAQAVVVAALDAVGLEKPVAFVILQKDSQVSEGELIEFCREGLPSFKRPRRVVFVEEYPTTATGKVRRVDLRPLATALLSESSPGCA